MSYTCLLTHIVFRTKYSYPAITDEIADALYAYICGISKQFKSPVLAINRRADHIHMAINVSPTVAVSKLVQEIEGEQLMAYR